MTRESLVYATPQGAEPVLAGTLVLMSIFRHNACPHAAQKIVHNLALLSKRSELSEEFRDLCSRLCEDWRCIPFNANAPQQTFASAAPSELLH